MARLLLFQEGIPDTFFPFLTGRGDIVRRFPSDHKAAIETFRENAGAHAIFFRANFALGAAAIQMLPKLKLAALVSTGADNVDTAALGACGVPLVTGAGANARAVFDYVVQALLCGGFKPEAESVGIVGAGRIGQMLLAFFREADVRCAYYDPFLREPGSLHSVLGCDYVTFHVPLTHGGVGATANMLRPQYFSPAPKKIRIIQTCRGGIWNRDFYDSLPTATLEILAQDVYPDEPPDTEAVARGKFSTPHIAGYSTLGRLGGIVRGIRALHPDFSPEILLPESRAWFLDDESDAFKARPGSFTALRDGYPWRKEFHEYTGSEREAFRGRFPSVPQRFFDVLWAQRNPA